MDSSGVRYWLALSRLRGLDSLGLRGLLQKFRSPKEIFGDSDSLGSFSASLARSVKDFKDWGWVDDEIALAEKKGARIVTFCDPLYPPLLREITDPPCLLYALGDLEEKGPAVGIVGTRHPSHYGLRMAETLGHDLAAFGATIVSGLARGCDMAAHKGALKAGGFTIAVLGTGVDIVYPRENKKLYEEIKEKGLVLSEFPISAPPAKYTFPMRNRIISGLSIGVVVVEAPLRSGSLMTARLALEYGREVFAVPGQATSNKSNGTNKLIKDGAPLVENAVDVAGALKLDITPFVSGHDESEAEKARPEGEEMVLWKALDERPAHIDDLTERTGLSILKASALLLEMEIKGLVKQVPGKCFLRNV